MCLSLFMILYMRMTVTVAAIVIIIGLRYEMKSTFTTLAGLWTVVDF